MHFAKDTNRHTARNKMSGVYTTNKILSLINNNRYHITVIPTNNDVNHSLKRNET